MAATETNTVNLLSCLHTNPFDDNGVGGGGNARETRVTGSCTAGSSAKLKAKPDDGRLETEFEVDQNRSGRRWNVVIRRNGVVVFRGSRITRPPSGSFSVNRRIGNAATAAVLDALSAEERSHIDAVAGLSQASIGRAPDPADISWEG